MILARINTLPELCKRTGIKRATMYNRMHDMGGMTLRELQEIAKATNMPADMIVEIVKNA
jgi:DNA-binding phage protein